MPTAPTRAQLRNEEPRYLSRGRAANADVRLVVVAGQRWVVKDFSACPWWIRQTLGRWMIGRELRALERLSGLSGIPQGACRIDELAFAYHFVDAKPLGQFAADALTPAFFEAYERLVMAMHARGLVHLDLRNSGNVLVDNQGQPVLIDFQSWLPIPRFWPSLAQLLRDIDLSGVYKFWVKRLPGTLGEEREARLAAVNRRRKFWVFSNYMGLRRHLRERQ